MLVLLLVLAIDARCRRRNGVTKPAELSLHERTGIGGLHRTCCHRTLGEQKTPDSRDSEKYLVEQTDL